jgi:predicted ArsR family transcriptional regulator
MRETRRRVLETLRKHTALTVAELAHELGLTRTAAVNQLRSLQSEGMAERIGVRASKRRPSMLYKLTADADRLFPTEYDTLAIGVIDELKGLGGRKFRGVVERLARRWAARDGATMKNAKGAARVEKAVAILSDRGLMPALERAGRGHVLRHYHCPLQRVGATHPEVCVIIERWIGALFGAPIKRIGCTSLGDAHCAYAIGRVQVSTGRQRA